MKIKKVLSAAIALLMLCSIPLSVAADVTPGTTFENGNRIVTLSDGSTIVYRGTQELTQTDAGGTTQHFNAKGQEDYVTDNTGKVITVNQYDPTTGMPTYSHSIDANGKGTSTIYDPSGSGNSITVPDQVDPNNPGQFVAVTNLAQLNADIGTNIKWGPNGIPDMNGSQITGGLQGVTFNLTGSAISAADGGPGKPPCQAIINLFGGDTAKATAFVNNVPYTGSASITLGNIQVAQNPSAAPTAGSDTSNPGTSGLNSTAEDQQATDSTTPGKVGCISYIVYSQGVISSSSNPNVWTPASSLTTTPPPINTTHGSNGPTALTTTGSNVAVTGTAGAPMQLANGTWVLPLTNCQVDEGNGAVPLPGVTIYVALPDTGNMPGNPAGVNQIKTGTGPEGAVIGQTITVSGRAVADPSGQGLYVMTDNADSLGVSGNTDILKASNFMNQNYLNALQLNDNMSTTALGWAVLVGSNS